jgi:hypothetical protein
MQIREVEFFGSSLIYAQITQNFGMRFLQNSTIFGCFLEDLPFGERTKYDDQKIRSCFRVSRELHRKKRSFFHKKRCFGKSRPTLPEKRREKLLQFFAFLKKSGIFSNFEFLKQPHYWTILKNTQKISICHFLPKNRDGQKKANFTFFKKHVFSQKCFLRFFTWEGLCQNEKIGSKNALSAI